jgi:hypothetical protein
MKKAKRKGSGHVAMSPVGASAGSPTFETPTLRKRPNLTIRLTAKLYEEIQKAAEVAGRSMSEEVERRLERAAEWDAVFESAAAFKVKFKADCAALERGDTEAVLPRRGYMKVFDSRYGGHAWVPPAHQKDEGTR